MKFTLDSINATRRDHKLLEIEPHRAFDAFLAAAHTLELPTLVPPRSVVRFFGGMTRVVAARDEMLNTEWHIDHLILGHKFVAYSSETYERFLHRATGPCSTYKAFPVGIYQLFLVMLKAQY